MWKLLRELRPPATRGRSNFNVSYGHNFVPARFTSVSLLARNFLHPLRMKANGDSPAFLYDLGPISGSWTEQAKCGLQFFYSTYAVRD